MIKTLENPFYYLENFHTVIAWVGERYRGLLTAEEQLFLERFQALPQASRALLVRMVMRKGELFRSSKLDYDEIGCTRQAAAALIEEAWLDQRPLLTLDELFGLLKKAEIATIFRAALPNAALRKAEQLEALRAEFPDARPFTEWHPQAEEAVYRLRIGDWCDRLRLMFFGNLRQGWSEFVLSDLGIYRYEKVEFSQASQGFRTRREVDDYLHLYRCRERFEQGEPAADVLADIPSAAFDNAWLENRRARLLFRIAQHFEQNQNWRGALGLYSTCGFPGARIRAIRVLERCGQSESALALADTAANDPESEAESQRLLRIVPRLRSKLGLPKLPAPATTAPARIDLNLPQPAAPVSVEEAVRRRLEQDGRPVHYVENTLINSLFGLLCWKAVFAPLPGAFFHPFHVGPADLHSADFHQRRRQEFASCLAQLDSQRYQDTIRQNFRDKSGIQSPFVFWGVLNAELLDLALACIPAPHLKKAFERILQDIPSNRAGFPDLIQFWPDEKRYRMIEVKGPGDRLQDNQLRWIEYCAAHQMPLCVCYVQWAEDSN